MNWDSVHIIPGTSFHDLDRAEKRAVRAKFTFCDSRQAWINNRDLEPEPTDAELVPLAVGDCPEPVLSRDSVTLNKRAYFYADGSQRVMPLSKALDMGLPRVVQYKGKIEKE